MFKPNQGDYLIIDRSWDGERHLNAKRLCFLGLMGSVDYWPLAKTFIRYLGVSHGQ